MFNDELLENFRKVYNSEHPNEIPIEKDNIWKSLKKRLHKKCKNGKTECIISHLLTKPKAPNSWITNPNEWLSSEDIENVESQFMKLFPTYNFLGCIPIDFDLKSKTGQCLVNTLCSLKVKDLYDKGFQQFGIVFNTDKHDGPGKHWFALFCDINPLREYPRITYFDSYATKPEKEIKVLMNRWKEEIDSLNLGKPTELSRNITKHQFKDSECGMYSIYYHYCCLLEIPMAERIPDDVIMHFRKFLFNIG
jgi:hypothetical protein